MVFARLTGDWLLFLIGFGVALRSRIFSRFACSLIISSAAGVSITKRGLDFPETSGEMFLLIDGPDLFDDMLALGTDWSGISSLMHWQ